MRVALDRPGGSTFLSINGGGACSEYRLQSAWRGGRGIDILPISRRGPWDRHPAINGGGAVGSTFLSINGGGAWDRHPASLEGGRGIDIPVDQPEGGPLGSHPADHRRGRGIDIPVSIFSPEVTKCRLSVRRHGVLPTFLVAPRKPGVTLPAPTS